MKRRMEMESSRMSRTFSTSAEREEERALLLRIRGQHAAKLQADRADRAKKKEEATVKKKEEAERRELERETAVSKRKQEEKALKDLQRQIQSEEKVVTAERIYLEALSDVARAEADLAAEERVSRLLHESTSLPQTPPESHPRMKPNGNHSHPPTSPRLLLPSPSLGNVFGGTSYRFSGMTGGGWGAGGAPTSPGAGGGSRPGTTNTTILGTSARRRPEIERLAKRVEVRRVCQHSLRLAILSVPSRPA